MFGLIRGCYLSPCEREHWNSHYCGLCLALKARHGQMSRMAVNGDAVLLSVVCEAQSPAPFQKTRHRCAFRGFRPVTVVAPQNRGAQYAAAMSVLMGAAKIFDHIADRETWIRFFPNLFSGLGRFWNRSARKASEELKFDTTAIETRMRQQSVVEKVRSTDFLFYSRPTELSAGAACAHTAVLAGVPRNTALLEQMGQCFGRIIYLLDSYRDYARDLATGRFNPLARCFPRERIPQEARSLFRNAHEEMTRCFDGLTLTMPALAAHLFVEKIGQIGNRTLAMEPDEIDLDLTPEAENKKEKWYKRFCDCCDCGCDCLEECGCCDGCCDCSCDGCGDCGGCDC